MLGFSAYSEAPLSSQVDAGEERSASVVMSSTASLSTAQP